MKTKHLLLCLLTILAIEVHCQNYKSVVSVDTLYYASKSYMWPYSNTLRTAFVVQSANIGNDSIHYFYPCVRAVSSPWACLDTLGPSWLGNSFVRNNLGEETYKNIANQDIVLKTLNNLNDTWKIVTDSNNVEIWGTITQIDTMTIDNQLDTVKTITLQAYLNMTPVSHFHNNHQIKLSKNHGFVTCFDFYIFPYDALNLMSVMPLDTGTFHRIDKKHSSKTLNEINFAKKFQPGNYWQFIDSFHTHNNSTFYTVIDRIQDSVISYSLLNPNCAVVNFYRITKRNSHSYTAPTPPNQTGFTFTLDTLFYTYYTDTICNPNNYIVLHNNIFPETHFHNLPNWIDTNS